MGKSSIVKLEEKASRMFPNMRNRAMARKLAQDKCVDVSKRGKLVEGTEEKPLVFELSDFDDDTDYAHVPTETWMWSVGKNLETGQILAATDGRFYQNPAYTCLWLR
jgi:hypothetical protein